MKFINRHIRTSKTNDFNQEETEFILKLRIIKINNIPALHARFLYPAFLQNYL